MRATNDYRCPATFTGTRLLVVEPSPSCPRALSPQQYATPPVVTPHVCSCPAVRLANVSPPLTAVGAVATVCLVGAGLVGLTATPAAAATTTTVVGNGDIDLVLVQGFVSHLDLEWDNPHMVRFLEGLASFGLEAFVLVGVPSHCLFLSS